MRELDKLDLSSIIVSVANSVTEANKILNEGNEAPMGITEFTVKFQVHASLNVSTASSGLSLEKGGVPVLKKATLPVAQLRQFTTLTPKEKILSGYLQESDMTITAKIEPMPRVEE